MTPTSNTRDRGDSGDQRLVLVWRRADGTTREFSVFPERPLTIGRDPANMLAIDSTFVSKQHAVVRYVDGRYVIEDLKSANGTRVNGGRIDAARLQAGDRIEVGDEELALVERGEPAGPTAKSNANATGPKPGKRRLVLYGGAGLGLVVLFVVVLLISSGGGPAPPEGEPSEGAVGATRVSGGDSATGGGSSPAAGSTAGPKGGGAVTGTTPGGGGTPPVPLPAEDIVARVLADAKVSGVNDVDALFDAAMDQHRGERLREAQLLLRAVLARNPSHKLARSRLPEIERETQQAITQHVNNGELAFSQLRYDTALLEWGQVLNLTDSKDPRHLRAQQRLDDAHRKLGR
jgi:hypothetical protein